MLNSIATDDRGFTLIELLVAMLAGVVVTGALFLILDVSLTQSTRVRNETAADQLSRVAMTRIVDQLHNACYYIDDTPVQKESTESSLIFTAAGTGEAIPKEAFERDIAFSGEELKDSAWKDTGGTWPSFTFSMSGGTSSVLQLATHISKTNGTEPIFRYYKYAKAAKESSTTSVSALEEIKLASGAKLEGAAAEVAAVKVGFAAGSGAKSKTLERALDLSNVVVFSFSVPKPETSIDAVPCE